MFTFYWPRSLTPILSLSFQHHAKRTPETNGFWRHLDLLAGEILFSSIMLNDGAASLIGCDHFETSPLCCSLTLSWLLDRKETETGSALRQNTPAAGTRLTEMQSQTFRADRWVRFEPRHPTSANGNALLRENRHIKTNLLRRVPAQARLPAYCSPPKQNATKMNLTFIPLIQKQLQE